MSSVEVINLVRSDSVDVVCELLQNVRPGTQVWLVVPWRMRLTRNLVNLKLFRRAADAAALDLRLVSADLETRVLAREAGIPVYRALPWPLRRYRRSRRAEMRGLDGRVVEFEGQLSRRWRRRPRNLDFGTVLLSFVVICALFASLLGGAALLVPSATVRLKPVAKVVSASFEVTAHPEYREIDYGRAIIPARTVQVIVSGRGETPATGYVDVPDGHSSGEVVLVNRTPQAVIVPKGTVVRTGSGVNVRFYTVADVELPAALYASARVGVIAFEPGPIGNVQPLTINVVEGPVAHLVNVLNDQPTRGGSIKRVPTVSHHDVDKLRAELIKRLQEEAYEQLVSELQAGEFIPPQSVEAQIMAEHFDQVLEQQSDVLSMEMKVVVRGSAVDGKSLETLARHFLESREKGLALIEGTLMVQRSDEVRIEERVAHLKVDAHGVLAPMLDMNEIKVALRGRKVVQAKDWLQEHMPLQEEPEISLFPQQWEWMPWLAGRIDVVISVEGQVSGSGSLGRT